LDPANQQVYLDGDDVTQAIRSPQVSAQVSLVSTQRPVRELLVDIQRALVARERTPLGWAKGRGVVAEGRDITTVVAPDADVRVLLTASPAARLARRALEVHGNAGQEALAATSDQVLRRDRDDSTVAQFEAAAPGVTVVDSSDLTLDQTVQAVLDLVAA
jgi:cytidylate kinase